MGVSILRNIQLRNLKDEIVKYQRLSAQKFIVIVQKYFDFKTLRDNPIIPEDIWIFNYLMYDNSKNQPILEIGEKINVKKGLKKTKLIRKYESQIIIPQLKALREAKLILGNLY